jgi:integrase/recombinase XerC
MRIKDFTKKYLRYCKVEKRNSESSIITYKYALSTIVSIIGNIEVKDIDKHTILKLKEELLSQSDDRQSLIISVLINFLRYLKEFEALEVFDYLKITIPRVRRKPPEILSQEFIDNFIENILPNKSIAEKRFKALNALLADTGLRIQEALDLPRDIDLEKRKAVVIGKGNKYRVVYWGERTIKALRDYLKARPEWDESVYLFATINKGDYGGKWNKGDVNRKFRYWSEKIGARIHCHKYRASFLSNCLYNGISLSAVSKAMGHSDIRTSMRYFAPMSDKNTEDEFKKYFTRKVSIEAKCDIKNLTN